MQRFEDNPGPARRHALHGLTAGALAFCCVVALALVSSAISHRSVSESISQAMQAEFADMVQTPATASPEVAGSPSAMQTARNN
jgi:hypothetical protein